MKIIWANTLRGVAALSVLIAHYVIVFWLNQGAAASIARRPPLFSNDNLITPYFVKLVSLVPLNFGAFGVALFFLISGFVISISLNSYTRTGFLINRIFRILPTYAVGYFIACVTIYFAGDPQGELANPKILFGLIPGLAMLIGHPVPGMGIEWSILVECVFYLICLFLYRRLLDSRLSVVLLCATLILLQVGLGFVKPMPEYLSGVYSIILFACPFLPIMLIGVMLSSLYSRRISKVSFIWLTIFLLCVHSGLINYSAIYNLDFSFKTSIFFAVACFGLAYYFSKCFSRNLTTTFFADISYPLYVIHPVMGYFMISLLVDFAITPILAVLGVTLFVIFISWIIHVTIERPSHIFGQNLGHKIR